MDFFEWYAWQEVAWRYWWVSVDLTNTSVSNWFRSLIISASKKSIRSPEYFWSKFNFPSPCCHNKQISSMYLHHTNNLKLQFCVIRSSRSPIKIMAYGGAILVPMAVSLSSLKKDKLCSKIWFFSTHSAKSIRESLDIVLSSLDSNNFLNAIKPSSCGIFGYKPTTSMVHRIMSSGKGGGCCVLHNR